MQQQQRRSIQHGTRLKTLVGSVLLLGGAVAASPAQAGNGAQKYKGSVALNVVSVAPNIPRCGEAPNVEAQFQGGGLDTGGGLVTVDATGCQNLDTGEVFDLIAVDTYADGNSINIVADSFFLVPNPQTCVSSNAEPVRFWIDGGTGLFDGATGGGKFDFATNDPGCNGEVEPAFIWFKGKIK